MERTVFAEGWQRNLAALGLENFKDFFSFASGQIINKNNKRDVTVMTFEQNSQQQVFFMKRFYQPHFKDMLFTLRNFGRLCSQAEAEWQNANHLLSNSIETYRPICFGLQTVMGIEKKSFIVTEKIKGPCFADFVAQNWLQLEKKRKEKIITCLGRMFRKIHNAGISLADLYVWHIFLTTESLSEKTDFAVIDLHRMKRNVTNKNELLKNLGRFHHSMIEKYFSNDDRNLLIEAYAGDNWPESVDKLKGKIEKHSRKVSKKRNPRPY